MSADFVDAGEPAPTDQRGSPTSGVLLRADRDTRIGFVTGIANGIAGQPYPPQVAIFAKGTEAEKLIVVALVDGRMDTIYRGRAVLANMTAIARMLAFGRLRVLYAKEFLGGKPQHHAPYTTAAIVRAARNQRSSRMMMYLCSLGAQEQRDGPGGMPAQGPGRDAYTDQRAFDVTGLNVRIC